ncbi:MAG: TetR/AcrR family transcriptional regulator [Dermatophilaceae bacterium]
MPARRAGAAPLSEAEIVAAARRVADREGMRSLSMRRVADELDVTAPALYWYVRGREELVAKLAEHLASELTESTATRYAAVRSGAEWLAATAEVTRQFRDLYRRYPGTARAVLRAPRRAAEEVADIPQVRALRRLGVSADDAETVFRVGAAWTLAFLAAESDLETAPSKLTDGRDESLFEPGLEWLLDGARAVLDR